MVSWVFLPLQSAFRNVPASARVAKEPVSPPIFPYLVGGSLKAPMKAGDEKEKKA
jgi:hypothetical protein